MANLDALEKSYANLSLIEEENPHESISLKSDSSQVQLALVGKVLAPQKIPFEDIIDLFQRVWGMRNTMTGKLLSDNVVLFQFAKPADKVWVLEKEPWLFGKFLLSLREPYERMIASQIQFTTSSFWIHVHRVPTLAMNEKSAKLIGDAIGKFVMVEKDVDGSLIGPYMRIKCEIDITKPLKRVQMIGHEGEQMQLLLQYEKLPMFCTYCGCLNHSVREYEIRAHAPMADRDVVHYSPMLGVNPNSSPFQSSWRRKQVDRGIEGQDGKVSSGSDADLETGDDAMNENVEVIPRRNNTGGQIWVRKQYQPRVTSGAVNMFLDANTVAQTISSICNSVATPEQLGNIMTMEESRSRVLRRPPPPKFFEPPKWILNLEGIPDKFSGNLLVSYPRMNEVSEENALERVNSEALNDKGCRNSNDLTEEEYDQSKAMFMQPTGSGTGAEMEHGTTPTEGTKDIEETIESPTKQIGDIAADSLSPTMVQVPIEFSSPAGRIMKQIEKSRKKKKTPKKRAPKKNIVAGNTRVRNDRGRTKRKLELGGSAQVNSKSASKKQKTQSSLEEASLTMAGTSITPAVTGNEGQCCPGQ